MQFDSYGGLNHSTVVALADALSAQLKPHGYEYLVLDGGWSAGKQCLTLPNGTKTTGQCLNEYGLPIPDPLRFPDIKDTVKEVSKRGLKLGVWTIRGIYQQALDAKCKVKGTSHTVNELVDDKPVGGGPNGTCLWAKTSYGVNMSHPAAQTFYDSRVELIASWGVDAIKADCMVRAAATPAARDAAPG